MYPRSRYVLLVLPMLVAFQAISTDLYLPALPAIILDLETDVARVQLTLSVFLVAFAVAQLVYGPLSDRLGRRPLLLAGTAIYAVASIACMLAASIESLIAFRLLQAIGACSGAVLGRAVVRDMFEPAEAARVLAYIATAMSLAPVAGPVLGGWLTLSFGWRASFAALTVFGVVAFLAVLRLPETNLRPDATALRPATLLANYGELLRSRSYLTRVLVAASGYSGIFAFISGSSHVLIDVVGLRPDLYGLCFGVAILGWAAGSFTGARSSRRLGLDRTLKIGTAISAGGGLFGLVLALGSPPGVVGVILPMFIFLVGAGLSLPAANALAIGPYPTRAGLASALLGFLQLTLAALVGIALSLVYDRTALPMMAVLALVGLLGALAARAVAGGTHASGAT